MPNESKCEYPRSVSETDREYEYHCPHPPLSATGLCIFHDPQYGTATKENSKDVMESLSKQITQSIENEDNPLKCIGFNIPDDIDLSGAHFKSYVFFNGTKFKRAIFYRTTFYKEANFSSATFDKEANFSSATFAEKGYFGRAKFNDEANFKFATFNKEVYFDEAAFGEKVSFDKATFDKGVDFRSATFSKEGDFIAAAFYNEASFDKAAFGENAYFDKAAFGEKASFDEATFKMKVSFDEATFAKKANFLHTGFESSYSFNDVLFEKAETVLFDVPKLSVISFVNTNVTRIRFSRIVDWDDITKLMNEESINLSAIRLEAVKAVYRNLRENYERSFRFKEAERFFTEEMELRRKYREKKSSKEYKVVKNGWFRKNLSLTGLYYGISRYGTNYIRPISLAIGVALIPISYSLIQDYLAKGALPGWERAINLTETGIRNITGMPSNQDIIGYFIGIVTIPILGAIILAALRRSFERRRGS